MKNSLLYLCATTIVFAGILASKVSAQAPGPMMPTSMPRMGPPPPPATPEMQRALDQLMSYDAPPIPTRTPDNARNTPSLELAAQEALSKAGQPAFGPTGDIFHRTISGANADNL